MLAATILFIATNAGVIGASRITYSMASYRQLPEVFRRLHPRFKTPVALARRLRRRSLRSLVAAAGRRRTSSARCTRSAPRSRSRSPTRRSSALRMPQARRASRLPGAAEPPRPAASTGRCSRSSAGSPPAPRFLVIVVQDADHALGRARLARGRARRATSSTAGAFVHASLARRPSRRRAAFGPGARARVPPTARAGVRRPARPTRRSTSPRSLAAERGAHDRRASPCSRFRSSVPLDADAARGGGARRPASSTRRARSATPTAST